MEERTGEQRVRAESEAMGQAASPSVWISHTVEQGAETFRRTIDQQRQAAARDLELAARRIRETAARPGGLSEQYGEQVARRLEAGAEYLRETELPEMAEGMRQTVRRYPWQSLGAAALVGFLLARMFRR
ncbi:MAG: hypothetical protein HY331_07285 [Chloroflexi bacterium]|nr:hypothetical protein [Chloroflexota bacterium]